MTVEMQNIFGTRLKLARKLAGFSLQELADALQNKVSKQALSKYELGVMNPTNEVLMAISQTLNLRPDYFLKKNQVELGMVEFRKRAGLSKKNEESIIERARDYVERYLEIEDILAIGNEFKNPLVEMNITNDADVEKAAQKLRESWNLGNASIANLVEMLEMKEIKVILIEDVDEVDGFAAFTSSGIPVVVVNIKDRSIERIRFTIIHELAHLLLRFSAEILSDKKRLEELCHFFSSCFLLPREMLIKMLGGSKRSYVNINELINIKEHFGISIRAIVHRARKNEIITDNYYQRWMVYMSKQFGSKNEPGHYQGLEKSNLLDQLVSRALSEGLISISKAAALCNISVGELRKKFISVS